jgi:hypothetical protein
MKGVRESRGFLAAQLAKFIEHNAMLRYIMNHNKTPAKPQFLQSVKHFELLFIWHKRTARLLIHLRLHDL